MADPADRILRPGDTCWRTARAERFSRIVDGADYLTHVKSAMLRARHRIMLIGWDFDYRTAFEADKGSLPGPTISGRFCIGWYGGDRTLRCICSNRICGCCLLSTVSGSVSHRSACSIKSPRAVCISRSMAHTRRERSTTRRSLSSMTRSRSAAASTSRSDAGIREGILPEIRAGKRGATVRPAT